MDLPSALFLIFTSLYHTFSTVFTWFVSLFLHFREVFRLKRTVRFLLIVAVSLSLVGCSGGSDELVIYSGRSKPLVDGLVEMYKQQSDVSVQVKYGRDAQLLAALQEEGEQTPADVYWANTTGALSNAVENDLLAELPDSILDRPQRFVPDHGQWTPVTTRFRVLAYNSDQVNASDLPDSVLNLTELESMEGRIGWTPTYSSFQDFLTVMRLSEGEDVTRQWLKGMKALNPKSYTSNTPMVRALEAGEIDIALTNHYYILRLKHGGAEGEFEGHEEDESEEEGEEEEGPNPSAPVETYHFESGDVGNLALVTGAGITNATEQTDEAEQFVEFLLSEEAQTFAAEQVNEYPVVPGAPVPDYMTPVEKALSLSPEFEPGRLGELEPTLEMLRDQGIL
jgi:iron(III) transport system substrate-binding protein